MGIRIMTVDESLQNNGVKVLVYGAAGSGKTTMAATTGGPTLIISAESGLLALAGAPDYIQVIEVKSIDDFDDAFEYIDEVRRDYDWIILDSVSEIAEVCLSAEKKDTKDPRQAYGAMIDKMTDRIKDFRNSGYNVLMTCKVQRIVDNDTGRTVYAPNLPGNRLADDIPYLFDEVLALRVEEDDEGESYRVLQTDSDKHYIAKDRSGELEMFIEPNIEKISKVILPKLEKLGSIKPPPVIATETTYYYDTDAGDVRVYEVGMTIDENILADGYKMTELEYDQFIENASEDDSPATEVDDPEEDDKSNPNEADRNRYFFHPESESVMVYEAGDIIDAEAFDECHEMTGDEYEEYMQSLEDKESETE